MIADLFSLTLKAVMFHDAESWLMYTTRTAAYLQLYQRLYKADRVERIGSPTRKWQ
jgi:hypothetical protein